jgi:FixJ family two-component response regulator
LLITDVRLPGQDGPALAAALLERRPATRVLFMSGYAGDAMVQSGLLGADVAFLAKPFTAAELGRRIRALLDDGGDGASASRPRPPAEAEPGPTP